MPKSVSSPSPMVEALAAPAEQLQVVVVPVAVGLDEALEGDFRAADHVEFDFGEGGGGQRGEHGGGQELAEVFIVLPAGRGVTGPAQRRQ
jgi:hypothetical protein